MNQTETERPVLIVSDSADELRVVRDLIKDDCPSNFTADSEEAGLRLFQERQPAVLVLAFQELGMSERFYLTLYRLCPTIQEISHQTLVLCKSNESKEAYSLCRNGTIDDYLVNRPMHDPYRLRLAVLQAQGRHAKRAQSASLNRQLSHIGSDLRHLDNFVSKTLTSGQANQTESLQSFREFASRLTRELDQFAARMNDAVAADSAKLIGHDGLREQFDKMRNDRIAPDARQVESQLQKTQQWASQFGDELHDELEHIGLQNFPPPTPEILLVDDDDVYREMLGTMLEEVGFRIAMAEDGVTALALMHKRRPDIVLLDYHMPKLDGIATLKKINAEPDLRQVPVLLLTGVSDRETVREVIVNGAAGYIVKPSNRPTILAKIRNLLPK